MADMRHLRRTNERRVVGAMLRLGRATRGDLSRETAMSQPTIGRIVDGLLASKTLSELDESSNGTGDAAVLGRPSRYLALNDARPRFLGIQLGVQSTRLALLPAAPPLKDQWQVEMPTPKSAAKWKEKLAGAAKELELKHLDGAVISLSGVVDEAASRVLFSPNLRWSEDLDFASIRPLLRDLPLVVGQEIRLLARGQSVIDPSLRNFLLVDLGSGVGAAIVKDGSVVTSALPLSGELGHSPVIGNQRPCSCGSVGCVETLVSRSGLLASAAEHKWPDTWPELVAKLQTAKELPAWLRKSLDALATTISAALNIIGLDSVVITGALRELPKTAAAYMQAQIEQGTMWRRFGPVQSRVEDRHRLAGMTALAIDRLLLAESS